MVWVNQLTTRYEIGRDGQPYTPNATRTMPHPRANTPPTYLPVFKAGIWSTYKTSKCSILSRQMAGLLSFRDELDGVVTEGGRAFADLAIAGEYPVFGYAVLAPRQSFS